MPYIFARTVRSCTQYNAAVGIGCNRRGGNQCKRGPCFKRAMGMFSGDRMDDVPKEVVLAFCLGISDEESHWANSFFFLWGGSTLAPPPAPTRPRVLALFERQKQRCGADEKALYLATSTNSVLAAVYVASVGGLYLGLGITTVCAHLHAWYRVSEVLNGGSDCWKHGVCS